MMAINARTFLCYKHAAKQMIAQGRGGPIIGPEVSHTSSRARVYVESVHSGACSGAGKKGSSRLRMISMCNVIFLSRNTAGSAIASAYSAS